MSLVTIIGIICAALGVAILLFIVGLYKLAKEDEYGGQR
jgi:hypothetical protein